MKCIPWDGRPLSRYKAVIVRKWSARRLDVQHIVGAPKTQPRAAYVRGI